MSYKQTVTRVQFGGAPEEHQTTVWWPGQAEPIIIRTVKPMFSEDDLREMIEYADTLPNN